MRFTALKSAAGATVLAVAALALPASSAQAQTRPAWCTSYVAAGVGVQFGSTRVIPGSPIQNTAMYSFVNTNGRPVTINASWDRTFIQQASMTVSVGAEYGLSPLATVKANVDASVTSSVSRSQAYSQPITVPAGRRLMTWWSVDLRQTSLRYVHHGVGCRVYRVTSWTWVTAPRSGTVKPQHAFVR